MRDDPVIITGGKRTGTRMIAQICERLGIYFGEVQDLGDRYEHIVIGDFMSEKNTEKLGKYFEGTKRWGLKHPTLSDYVNTLFNFFPKAQFVYTSRDFIMPQSKNALGYYWGVNLDDKNCEKCLKKRFEKKQKERLERFNKNKSKNIAVLYIHYDDFVFIPVEGTKQIASFLGLQASQEILDWVKTFVYTNRSARNQI